MNSATPIALALVLLIAAPSAPAANARGADRFETPAASLRLSGPLSAVLARLATVGACRFAWTGKACRLVAPGRARW